MFYRPLSVHPALSLSIETKLANQLINLDTKGLLRSSNERGLVFFVYVEAKNLMGLIIFTSLETSCYRAVPRLHGIHSSHPFLLGGGEF